VKNRNAAAIQAAWNFITSNGGGTILIPGIIEVGRNTINLGDNTSHFFRTTILGLGPDVSMIVSESTGNAIDMVGRSYVTIKDLQITSATAKTGILMARNSTSPNCVMHYLEGVWIDGAFSIASLVMAASESNRVTNCFFRNSGTKPAFWTSPYPSSIPGLTTVNGSLYASSNTNISFYGTEFTNWNPNASVVRISDGAQVTFYGSTFTGGNTNGVKLLHLDARANNVFRGPVTVDGCLFEGGGGYAIYTENAHNVITSFHDISVRGTNWVGYPSGFRLTGWPAGQDAYQWWHNWRLIENRYIDPDSAGIDLPNTLGSVVEYTTDTGKINIRGVAGNGRVTARRVTWGPSGMSLGVLVEEGDQDGGIFGRTTYGNLPSSGSAVNGGFSRSRTLRLAPVAAPYDSSNRATGVLAMVDPGSWVPVGIRPVGNKPYLVHWDGTQWKMVGSPIPATPTSAKAACSAGSMTYDASYIYLCTADNVWKRAAITAW
jgi:hypothetical protein